MNPSSEAAAKRPRRRGLLRLRQEIPRPVFIAAGWAVPLVLLLLWWAVTASGLVQKLFLPSPGAILAEGWRQLSEELTTPSLVMLTT